MAKRETVGDVIGFELPSGVPVEIQEITAEAERWLTDKQAMKSGKGLNKFILKALVSYDGKPLPENEGEAMAFLSDMRTGDRNYLILRIRMQSYGDEMVFNHKCPKCGKTSGYQVNFQQLLDDGTLKVYPYREDVPVTVETRGGTAEVDYMTGRTEQWLAQQKELDTIHFAMAACKSFNGHAPTYKEFEGLFAKDISKIRLAFMDLKGGLDARIELDCPKCDSSYDVLLYSIDDFFTPLTTSATIGL